MFMIYAELTNRFTSKILPTQRRFANRIPDDESFAEHIFRLCPLELREQEHDVVLSREHALESNDYCHRHARFRIHCQLSPAKISCGCQR